MSQYNFLQYNLGPYNIDGVQHEIFISVSVAEEVSSLANPVLHIYRHAEAQEIITSAASVKTGHFLPAGIYETVAAAADMLGLYAKPAAVNEIVSAEVSGIIKIKPPVSIDESVSSGSSSGGWVFVEMAFEENITGGIGISGAFYGRMTVNELVNTVSSTNVSQKQICILDITLLPGQTLIVDSDNYIVLLDGENRISCHSGDWIDELDRDTEAININAESGIAGMEADISYRSRYL